MRERVYRFGPQRSLVGIFTEPSRSRLVPNSPIAIILNAGIVHHVGPFRLHVDLARQLAERGFRTLRVDLSGLGDSAVRSGKMEAGQRALLDVRDAMDMLTEKQQAHGFVLMGLCSGAFNAHRASFADDRVVGAVFMDGIAFRTLGFYFRWYLLRLMRPRFWRNFFLRRHRGLTNRRGATPAGEKLAEQEFFGLGLRRDATQRELQQLLDRGVNLLFLYTDGYDDIAGARQFKEMYGLTPNNAQLQLEYYDKSEHTFRLTQNRQNAVDRVADWFLHRFGVKRTPLSA